MANCTEHTETREKITKVEASASSAHKRLDAHEKRLDGHDSQIEILALADAKQTTQIDNVCKQMGSLTNAIWGLIITIITLLLGFFIWYVQTGGVKK